MPAIPLQVEEVTLLSLVNGYTGIRSELANEAVKVIDSPNFTHLVALYHLDSLRTRQYVLVDPVSRFYTLTPTGLSALYEGIERMNRLTQTFTALKERK